MPSVSLTVPVAGPVLLATHLNNYAALQSAINALDANNWATGKIFAPSKLTQEGATTGQALVWDGSQWSPNPIYRKTTEKDVANTGAETDLLNGEITIAANAMGTSRLLRATLIGDYLNNTGAGQTITLKIKLGATTLYSDVTPSLATDANRHPLWVEFEIVNLGANNSQFMHGRYRLGAPGGAATGIGDLSFGDTNGASFATSGTSAVDTSVAQVLAVTVTHSAANVNLSARLKAAIVEIV